MTEDRPMVMTSSFVIIVLPSEPPVRSVPRLPAICPEVRLTTRNGNARALHVIEHRGSGRPRPARVTHIMGDEDDALSRTPRDGRAHYESLAHAERRCRLVEDQHLRPEIDLRARIATVCRSPSDSVPTSTRLGAV